MNLSLARPPFSASKEWILSAFGDIGGLLGQFDVPAHGGLATSWVAALMMHGSTQCISRFQENYDLLLSRSGGVSQLQRGLGALKASGTYGSCLDRIAKLTGFRASQRTTGCRVLTPNPYSRDYLPPAAVGASEAVRHIFRLRAQYRGSERSDAARALATYITLLTAHALVDGNGRTARMLMVADSIAGSVSRPILPLAALWLKSQRALPFHLSARCARAGDFQMLADSFVSATRVVTDRIGPLLQDLDAVSLDDSITQSRYAAAMHAVVSGSLDHGSPGSGPLFS